MGNSPLRFTVLQKDSAIQALIQAERIDHYLEECYDDLPNSLARLNYSYHPNRVSSTIYYTNAFNQIVSKIPKQLHSAGEVAIVVLMPSADGGMPHTRPPNIICYPDLSGILHSGVITNSFVRTLIHELCHVHQRKFPAMWATIFEAIGWIPWRGELPTRLDNYRRYNPDTIDSPLWIHGEWVPIPVFKDGTKPVLSEVEIWFYHKTDGYHVKSVPEDIYIEGLPASAYEHPREITAYMISEPERYVGTSEYAIIKKYVDI
jgi:hypothetical protein